jgi:alpha-methylacyl-CoA racemase
VSAPPGHAHRPLHGVRVLDLTRLLPGACATLLLADLGADVVKIEDPRGGDDARHMPPLANGTSVYFQVLNRNKRSVTLDLRSPDAKPVLDALARQSDVVVDSFRPSTARRLGVDAATLGARHPRLIRASITGFGQTGPYADRAAHDINYEALVGLLTVGGRPSARPGRTQSDAATSAGRGQGDVATREGRVQTDSETRAGRARSDRGADQSTLGLSSSKAEPRVPRLLIADIGAAIHTASGILAALYQRERTGLGVAVDISIHEAALAWMLFPSAPDLVGREDAGDEPLRDRGQTSLPPLLGGETACYNVYETADGRYLALGALEPKFWIGFCERIGRPDLAPFQQVEGDERERVLRLIREIMRTRTCQDWLAMFADADVCLTPINTLSEALADPHLLARRAIVGARGTRYITAPIAVTGDASAGGWAAARNVEMRPAPALGADTDEILESAGIGAHERAGLRQQGVI